MRHYYYVMDDPPIVDWDGKRPIKGTPEYWEKQGFNVYRNKPTVFTFTVEVEDDNADDSRVAE